VTAALASAGGVAKARNRRRHLARARRRRLQRILLEERAFGENVAQNSSRIFLVLTRD
jgi:hypothetical protein